MLVSAFTQRSTMSSTKRDEMNNAQYHRAGKAVLNWKKLTISMQARYSGWIIKSSCSWAINYKVTVTHHNGRRLSKPSSYPFEFLEDARVCIQWWKDNGCLAVLEEVRNEAV
jgi:hypothetical protein